MKSCRTLIIYKYVEYLLYLLLAEVALCCCNFKMCINVCSIVYIYLKMFYCYSIYYFHLYSAFLCILFIVQFFLCLQLNGNTGQWVLLSCIYFTLFYHVCWHKNVLWDNLSHILLHFCFHFQAQMSWSGFSTTSRASRTAAKPGNTPATCWRPASFDTPSTRSPSPNSATTSSGT